MAVWSRARVYGIGAVVALVAATVVPIVLRHGADRSLDTVQARGELRVGYAVEAPYALLQADGTPGGESPEVARAVAQRLGLRVAWVLTDFDRLIPELERGRFDLVASGLFVTPERKERVRFTRPTLRVRPGWLRRADAAAPLGPYRLAGGRAGLQLAVVRGSVEAATLAALAPGGATVLVVPDARTGQEAVASGRSDGLALSMPTVATMAAGSAGQLRAEPADAADEPPARVALALRLDDASLAEAVDAALAGYLRSPEHLAMLARLGLGEDDLPAPGDTRP